MDITLLEINDKLDTIINFITPVIKNNKSKQEINKSYYQKMKESDNEKYEKYLQKCRDRYFKNKS
jgi:hypothetical protein